MNGLMITRITKANADKYRALFAEAEDVLKTHDMNGVDITTNNGTPVISSTVTFAPAAIDEEDFQPGFHFIKVGEEWKLTDTGAVFAPEAEYAVRVEDHEHITTLEEYFCNIATLCAVDEKFTILPLEDEENFFSIDANTRVIDVPKAFKDNGISVQGDEISEVLYFKIDRYFDMTDLGEKKVFIQWRAPADKTTGIRKEGVSTPWVFTTSLIPGYVVFGWPLSSEITERPGNVDFAVRFYEVTDDERGQLVYSLSTLTATATIKESLNYNIEEIYAEESAIDASGLIYERLINSTPKDDDTPDPQKPILIELDANHGINTIGGFDKMADEVEGKEYNTYKVYMTNTTTGDEVDGTYTIQAYSPDTGIITYSWIRRDAEGEIIRETTDFNTTVKYIPVDDTEMNSNKVYYIDKGEGAYAPFYFNDATPDLEAAAAQGIQLFERISQIKIIKDQLGTYQARITNRLGRKTEKIKSDLLVVEGPAEPVISKDLNTLAPGLIKDIDGELGIFLSVEANTDVHSFVSYDYEKLNEETGNFDVLFNSTKKEEFIEAKEYDETDMNNGDGTYRITVKSLLNGVTEEVASNTLRVTHEAVPVSIEQVEQEAHKEGALSKDIFDIRAELGVKVEVSPFEVRTDDDSIDFVWYKWSGKTDDLTNAMNEASRGEFVPTAANATELKLGTHYELGAKGTPDSIKLTNTPGSEEMGYYFCKAINHYNGSEAFICSKFFFVMDAVE